MINAWERQACLTVNASATNLSFAEVYFSISMRKFSSCHLMFSEIKNPNQKIRILRGSAFFKGSIFFTNITILFF
jgi:hypothetical protein